MIEINLIIVELGAILVVGFLGSYLLKKFRIPQVLGFILSGLVIGVFHYYFKFIPFDLNVMMPTLVTLALGIIGFNIGAELSWEELKKVNRKHFAILLADSIGTFLIVSTLVYFLTDLSLNFSLILGALASATAPAATADVLWEYKSSGPLTQAVLFILAVDDIISILLVQITTNITKTQIPGSNSGPIEILTGFSFEVGIALALGLSFGLFIVFMINTVNRKNKGRCATGSKNRECELLELILGSLVLLISLSMLIGSSAVLGTMVFGIIVASLSKRDTEAVFSEIYKIGSPIVATFFIGVGITMDFDSLKYIGVIGIVYLVSRTIGKVGAVGLTAKIVKAPKVLQKYLGLCLFSQAGVALGLAVSIQEMFEGTIFSSEAVKILSTITGTIIIIQIIGPLLVKLSIKRAGEIGQIEIVEDVEEATGVELIKRIPEDKSQTQKEGGVSAFFIKIFPKAKKKEKENK
ncbi:MAG: cation:proton antiporter [Candidatus Heimdallarchaeaceae archaeon]